MKQGWEIKKLGDICHTSNGLWKGKKPPFITIGVLRSTNFTKDCRLKLDDVAYIEVEENSFAKRKLQKNDIVVERSGGGPNQPVGRVLLFDIDDDNFSFCNFTSALRVIDSSYISPIYLHKYLNYFYLSGKTIEMQSNTIGLRNLDYTKYLDIDVPIPSLAEQERIVEILDREFERIDALKANAEQNLQHAKNLFQAALKNELETIDSCTIKDLYNIRTGKLNSNAAVKDGKYPFFTCSREVFSINDYAFDNEAILLAGNNASGDFNVKYYKGKFNAYQRTYVITAKHKETNVRMLYFVLTNYLTELKKMSLGANTKFLKLGMVEDVKVPIYDEQNIEDVVARLDKLNERCKALEENYKKTIALCDDMKQALLRKAFNGEL